jgi:copper(I)-binding protein
MTRALALIVLAGALLAACAPTGAIRVENAWSRPAAVGANGAAYFTLRNSGAADRLVAVSSDVARVAELHQTTIEGGVARMAKVSSIDVPAGGSVELKPGSFHVMLIGLNRELRGGDTFPLTLTFASGATGTVLVTVKGSAPEPTHAAH